MGDVERPGVTRDVSCSRTRVACGNRGRPTMERRKFIIGAGALATGSSAAIGTGAFTTASLQDRSVSVSVADDSNAQIALSAGDNPDISADENGELEINLTGENGEGVNIGSVYTWGDPSYDYGDSAAAESYAFKIQNNDEQTYNTLTLEYELTNASDWFNGQTYPSTSKISFYAFTETTTSGSMTAPANNGSTSVSVDVRDESSQLAPSHNQFKPGDQIYVVVQVDTTGSEATSEQDLGGNLTISATDPA